MAEVESTHNKWLLKITQTRVSHKKKTLNARTGTNHGSVVKSIQPLQATQSLVGVKEDYGLAQSKIH